MWPFRPKSDKLFNRNFTFEPKPQQLSDDDYSFQLSPSSKFPPAIIRAFADDSDDSSSRRASTEETMSGKLESEPPCPSISPSAGLTRYEESIVDSEVESDDDDCGSFIINESEVASIISIARPEVTCLEVQRPRTAQVDPAMQHFLDLSDSEDEEELEEEEDQDAIDGELPQGLVNGFGKSPAEYQHAVQALLEESPTSSHHNSIVNLIRKGVWFEDGDSDDEDSEMGQDAESTVSRTSGTVAPRLPPLGLNLSIPPRPKTNSWLAEASVPNTPSDTPRSSLRISWFPKSYASSFSSSGMDFFLQPENNNRDLYLTPEPSPLLPPSPFTPDTPFGLRDSLASIQNYKTSTNSSSQSVMDRVNSLVLRHYSIDMAAGIPRIAAANMSQEAFGELYWPENA